MVYNLNDPSVNFPALVSYASQTNAIHSPTAWKTKGDDYNRNPVGTGPYILKSWTAGDRMILEKNPDYWDKDKVYFDRITLKPLPDAQSRFASLQSGEVDLIWDDEYSADNIQKAQKDSKLTVHTYDGSGAQVYAFNTKVAPFDDLRVRQALVMALDRKKMSQAITNGLARPASNPYGDGSWVKCKDDGALPEDLEKAKALIKDYGKPVEFKMLVTATPRGRTIGQVLQQFWKRAGANMEIEQVDQATIPPRAFMRQFQLTPWRIVDLADPDIQMYANFKTGSPVALANYSNPELDKLLERARVTAEPGQAHRRLLRDHAADQQGGDLVLDLPEHLLRNLEREGQRTAQNVQRDDRRIARLEGIAAHGVLRRTPAPVSGAGADCGFAADVLDRVAVAGRSCLYHPR